MQGLGSSMNANVLPRRVEKAAFYVHDQRTEIHRCLVTMTVYDNAKHAHRA